MTSSLKLLKAMVLLKRQVDQTPFKHMNGKTTILIAYVDDIILTGDNLEEMEPWILRYTSVGI